MSGVSPSVATSIDKEANYDPTDRNGALRLIEWFNIDRVQKARVAVIGAGAIGNEVLKNLALLGLGSWPGDDSSLPGGIFIFDKDTIEMANLARSILFRAKDAAAQSGKAETAALAVKEINPTVNVSWRHDPIEMSLGEGFLRSMDVVIGCLDNLEARFLLNRLCWKAGRPWIDAGIGSLAGQVRAYLPPDGACFECMFADAVAGGMSCGAIASANVKRGRMPTTPTMASLVAAIQVQECLKLLAPSDWVGRTLANKQFSFDSGKLFAEIDGLARRDKCLAHVDITAEDVIPLPAFSATLPAIDLLAEAEARFGEGASLVLPEDVALNRPCPKCGHVLEIYRPKSRLFREDLTCDCGKTFQWDSDITQTHRITRRSPTGLLNASLLDLGVARGGFVEANYGRGEVVYLELSGDIPVLMNAVGDASAAAAA
jgi:adenylyltransferase/sulfurtransferase